MAKRPTPGVIAADLTVRERILLFCIGSGTDWAARRRDRDRHGGEGSYRSRRARAIDAHGPWAPSTASAVARIAGAGPVWGAPSSAGRLCRQSGFAVCFLGKAIGRSLLAVADSGKFLLLL